MCGFVGIVGRQQPTWITHMNDVQAYRGPDDEGVYRDEQHLVSLAFRRLSIVDLVEGHQPMLDMTHSRVLVFNGEIFNAPQLRADLEAQGYRFKTRNSDTEILLHLYDLYGEAMLDRLNGMFAFVVYDRHESRLFGARDRVGIKPLHYLAQAGRFAFASEIKSLLTLPFVSRELNVQSAHHYLTLQFVPAPQTIFEGIQKLPAGHCFRYDIKAGQMQVRRYWRPPAAAAEQTCPHLTEQDAASELRTLLRHSVRDWLMSDVPVGCSLSGGLDSSAVVGLMVEQGIGTVRTWSLGFEDEAELDERGLASIVARRWNTEHHEIVLRSDNVVDDLEKMVWHLEEPYAGGLPSWYVYKAMSADVKVAMTGTGGDELFGNYGKWRPYEMSFSAIRHIASRLLRNGITNTCRYPHGALYHGYFFEREKKQLWSTVLPPFQSTPRLIESYWRLSCNSDPRQAVPFVDMQMQLPEEFLFMTDRFSMAWSLEARTPLLDHRLIEFALRLPGSLRTNAQDLKRLFRVAVSDLVPDELLAAPKRGFILPVSGWLRGRLRPVVEHLLGMQYLRSQGLFRPEFYSRFVRPHLDSSADYGWQIWTVLMFQMWWSKFIDSVPVVGYQPPLHDKEQRTIVPVQA
jgi:asparagine synthase (glutamine-hydrolysing)